MNKILLINDYVNYEQVALKAMEMVLSFHKYECLAIPTCVVSNTFDYGKFSILDTTDYLTDSLKIYSQLHFSFNCICSGYLNNIEQAKIIEELKKEYASAVLMVDPIMADNGKLYNGKTLEHVKMYQRLIKNADITVPNYTESCLLADVDIKEKCSIADLKDIITRLKNITKGHIIITSCHLDNDMHCIFGYDSNKDETFTISYEFVNASFAGTGDVFSSYLINHYLIDNDIKKAAIAATNKTSKLLKLNIINNPDLLNQKHKSIKISQFLNQL